MSNTTHKGQLQVVEGSPVGDFYTIPKFDYDSASNLLYLGEAAINKTDRQNAHFIQKFLYNSSFNLIRIVIATNITTTGTTLVFSLAPLNSESVDIVISNGDFDEVNLEDQFSLNTGTQVINGTVVKKLSNMHVEIKLSRPDLSLTPQTNVTISATDLMVTLVHANTKDYTKRRWDHRTRYSYSTLASQ